MKHLKWYLFTVLLIANGMVCNSIGSEADAVRNLFANEGAEKPISSTVSQSEFPKFKTVASTEKVPENWGVSNGTRLPLKWGISTLGPHSGQNCCFLEFTQTGKTNLLPQSGISSDHYIWVGKTDGDDGSQAIQVKPDTKYLYSFWIKGNAKEADVRVFTWPIGSDKSGKVRNAERPRNAKIIYVSPKWTRIAGTFDTSPITDRIALGICPTYDAPGQSIFVDDVIICECPKATLTKRAASSPQIAIYNSELCPDSIKYIKEALKEAGYHVDITDTLKREVINKYDVLILTSTRQLSSVDKENLDLGRPETDFAGALLNFVDAGGGLILGHDCVGTRGIWEVPLFPSVCSGKKISNSKKMIIATRNTPISTNSAETFEHSYSDHATINPGKDATVLFNDNENSPVVVSGKLSRGRIVAIGYPMGIKDAEVPCPVNENEKNILLNAVKWCAESDKYIVPQELTDATLLAEFNDRKLRIERGDNEVKEKALKECASLPLPHFDEASVWLFPHSLTPEKIAKIVENCKKLGFNKIILGANRGFELFYKSDLYPKDMFYNENRRPEYSIDAPKFVNCETKKHGMKFGVFVCPFTKMPIFQKQSVPMEITSIERALLDKGEVTLDKLAENRNRWACPAHPENQKRALSIIKELIEKYSPDEILFDYVRYSRGYEYPCYCDYCIKKKPEFAAANPNIKKNKVDLEFAKYELMKFYTEVNTLCKKMKPSIVTSCYTYSGDSHDWVFAYPFDRHYRYVSRLQTDLVTDVGNLTSKYTDLLKKYNPQGMFVPILANKDHINGERMYIEMALLSHAQDMLKTPHVFNYYNYGEYLSKDYEMLTGEVHEDLAKAFDRALNRK